MSTDLVWPSTVPGIPLNLRGGKQIDLRNPKITDFTIEDIAGPLSRLCRFSGHVPRFYSVAQHSVLVAFALPKALRLQGLLHDASEAYMNDITRALKHSPEMAGYRALEAVMEATIFRAFGLPETMDPRIKQADNDIAHVEYRTMLRDEDLTPSYIDPYDVFAARWGGIYDYGGKDASDIPFKITPLIPEAARVEFLRVFYDEVANR